MSAFCLKLPTDLQEGADDPTTIVWCQREFTDHVMLRFGRYHLTLIYGNVKAMAFEPLHRESLLFAEFPELSCLYRSSQWNWGEVWNLIEDARQGDPAMPMRVYLAQADALWLERVIRHARTGSYN